MVTFLILELLAVTALIAIALTLLSRSRRARLDRDSASAARIPAAGAPDDSVAARAATIASAARGTRADWDRHVRPVLAKEFAEITANRHPHAPETATEGERHRAGVRLFGATLWPLVDPEQAFTTRLGHQGPGPDALEAIVDRLEEAT
ncbi:hypothetical protein [Haloechinothrix sp. LS1_15]|uniref:hypothetical protein n=1 Tax=Haloechinothrix sp. LS1_15 TaxID=2652248 RepID=UPI002946D9B8|nr:hypothetical protein [Haloechinothrix sp. LS1_15]MDV6014445.1 hypothetical protein [Haloechinothrix sp. LS1_15]